MQSMTTILLIEDAIDLARVVRRELEQEGYHLEVGAGDYLTKPFDMRELVARIRLPEGGWSRQVLWEIGVGLALGLVMTVGLLGSAALLGWDRVWLQSNLRSVQPFALLLLGIGPGYSLTRCVLRLYLLWNRLRRRRMVWSLTHAHLTVVVIAGILVGIILTFSSLRYSSYDLSDARGRLGVLIAENFLHTLFPAAVVMLVTGTAVMVIVLPPSALFSFLIARRTTRRLEDLTGAAGALKWSPSYLMTCPPWKPTKGGSIKF